MKKQEFHFIFVGERPSQRSIDLGVTWQDGALAAKQLFDALRACGIDPNAQTFLNLFIDSADIVNDRAVKEIQNVFKSRSHTIIIALGRKVEGELTKLNIHHRFLTHPAARGKIRKKERYAGHVKKVLLS